MNIGQLKELTDRLDALKESETTMKDEMYIALRSYAEEHSSLLRQILEELKARKTPATVTPDGTIYRWDIDKSEYVPASSAGDTKPKTSAKKGK